MKAWRNLMMLSVRSMQRNRARSLLTSLGIIIGVAAVIVMVGIGQGTQASIKRELSSLGTNLIVVFPGASRMGGVSRGAGSFNRLTLDDVETLRKDATLLSGVSPVVRTGSQVIGGGNNWSTAIYGVGLDYFDIRDWALASGERFTERDIRARVKVAVLGSVVAGELFGDTDPVGETIQIRSTPFKVIGVLEKKGQNAMGMDQDDVILAPSTTVLYRLKGGQYIDMINASAVSNDAIGAAQEEIRTILRQSQGLETGEDDTFTIRNQAELTEAASAMSRTLTLLLGSIAGVSLVVGGIGIMNIMLVSVTERTREIGIRLSVGARSRDILAQFLAESITLALAGGVVGIALAFAVAIVLGKLAGVETSITPAVVALSASFAGAVGVFFGLYPARKVARLDPIEALRHE